MKVIDHLLEKQILFSFNCMIIGKIIPSILLLLILWEFFIKISIHTKHDP